MIFFLQPRFQVKTASRLCKARQSSQSCLWIQKSEVHGYPQKEIYAIIRKKYCSIDFIYFSSSICKKRLKYFPETVPRKRQISRQVGIGVFVNTENEVAVAVYNFI